MTRERAGRHFALAFVLALVLYIAGFRFIEHLRQEKGPWRITFRTDAAGQPSVSVSQEKLHITNVNLVFLGEQLEQTNTSAVILFEAPTTSVPFGQVLFVDTISLPGTVALSLFGHEIEFIPRGLFVNRKETPWKSGMTIQLSGKDKMLKGQQPSP